MKAKHVLLRRLGILKEDEPATPAALDKYARLFERPLAADVVEAFADFYGWRVPCQFLDSLASPTVVLTVEPRLIEI